MKKRYFDFSLVITLFLVIVWHFYFELEDVVSFSLNDIVAVCLLAFSLRFLLFQSTKGKYIILLLIVLSFTPVFGTSVGFGNFDQSFNTWVNIGILSFDPFAFLLLLFFLLIYRSGLREMFNKLRYGSETKKLEEEERKIGFYYERFTEIEPEELEKIFGMYNDYPVEAQIALIRIRDEKDDQ